MSDLTDVVVNLSSDGVARAMTATERRALMYHLLGDMRATATAGRSFTTDDDLLRIPLTSSGAMTIPSGLLNPMGASTWSAIVEGAGSLAWGAGITVKLAANGETLTSPHAITATTWGVVQKSATAFDLVGVPPSA